MPFLPFLLAESNSYQTGRGVGAQFWLFALLYGVYACGKTAQKKEANSKCCYGLMSVYLGWFILAAYQAFFKEVASQIFFGMALGVSALSVCAGFVLSILGLVEYYRTGGYALGRRHGFFGVFFSLMLATLFGFGVYTAGRAIKTVPQELQVKGPHKTEFVHKDLNIRFSMPPKPFMEWNAKTVNPNVTFALMSTNPQVSFMLVAERIGVEYELPNETLVELSQSGLQSRCSNCTFGKTHPHAVGPMHGLRYFTDTRVNHLDLSYVHWVYSNNGFAYQLITFGRQKHKKEIRRISDSLCKRFSQINPEEVAHAKGPNAFNAYTSEKTGLKMDLTGTAWQQWPECQEENPEAEIGGLLKDHAGFLVSPAFVQVAEVPLNAVTRALLEPWGMSYPDESIRDITPVTIQGVRGYDFQFQRTVDDTPYQYMARVVQKETTAFLVVCWTVKGKDDPVRLGKRLFDAIAFGDVPKPQLAEVPDPWRPVHANYQNQIGLYFFEREAYRKSLPFFKRAMTTDTRDVVFLTNALSAYCRLGAFDEGLAFLKNLTHPKKAVPETLSWKAWMLKNADRPAAARKAYASLFGGGYREDDDFGAYIDLLVEEKAWAAAESAFASYLKKGDTPALRAKQAWVLEEQGKHAEAVALLIPQHKSAPFNSSIAFGLIRNYGELDQHRNALEVCNALIESGACLGDAYFCKGRSEYNLKWFRKAKASFESALKHNPDDEEIKDYLRYTSGLIGEGRNSQIKEPIKAVPLPAHLEGLLKTAALFKPEGDASAYFRYWVECISFGKDKPYTATIHERIKVLDPGGVSRYSTMTADFDPLSEHLFVNSLVVYDEKGKVVSKGNVDDYYAIDKESNMATHDQTLHIPIASLKPGYEIELVYTRQDHRPGSRFPYSTWNLTASCPVGLAAVCYQGDPSLISAKTANAVTHTRQGGESQTWYTQPAPVIPWQPMQAPLHSFAPYLWLGPTNSTWAALGDEYLTEIAETLTTDRTVSDLATALTKGCTTTRSRVAALLRHTRRKFTYKPIEFGRRGRIPNTAAETIQKSYGDCKDLAVLLHQLLAAVDVPSKLVLVNTYGGIEETMPSLDQFNHMIVYLPELQGGQFIDVTERSLSLDLKAPIALGDTHALLLQKDGSALQTIPAYAPNSSRIHTRRSVKVTAKRVLQLEETISLSGYYAAFLRDHFQELDKAKHSEWMQNVLTKHTRSARLITFALKNMEDCQKELILIVQYQVPDGVLQEKDGVSILLPAAWEARYLSMDLVQNRISPFRWTYPLALSSRISMQLPADLAFVQYSATPKTFDAALVNWTTHHTKTADGMQIKFACHLQGGRICKAKEYAPFCDSLNQAIGSVSGRVLCRQAGEAH